VSIDLLLIRESTEGLFFSRKERLAPGAGYAEDKLRITRRGNSAQPFCFQSSSPVRPDRGGAASWKELFP
jgi:hypothetical protein